MQAARARAGLGGTEDDAVPDAELSRHLGKRGARDQRYLEARQLALIEIRIGFEQSERHDHAQDGVTQKLKTLV